MSTEQFIEFIQEADKLKNINRKSFTYHSERYENSGEHSWHLALAILVFASESDQKIDILKCLKMALIHDVVEIDAGDNIVYAEDSGKFDREFEAAKRIFGLLPENLRDEYLNTWIEFEKKETPESQFVGALDRFLPMLSNIIHKGNSWRQHGITKEQVYNLNQPAISKGSLELWKFADAQLKKAVAEGHLKTDADA